jgi:hypothetical protein
MDGSGVNAMIVFVGNLDKFLAKKLAIFLKVAIIFFRIKCSILSQAADFLQTFWRIKKPS